MTGVESKIDTADLESFLTEALDTAVVRTEVLDDGLNLIIAISTETEEDAYILRRPNKLRHTALFNDLEREYRVLERLEDTAVPAPKPVLFCDDASIIGDSFFLTTYLDGETVPLGADLPKRFRNPTSRARTAELLVDALAGIHSVNVGPFEDVCEHHTPREQVDHAIDRLDVSTSVTGDELSLLREIGDWLHRNAPTDPGMSLVHGDFRPSNVLFGGTDRPVITGVLDWETAMLGDPLTELGYLLLRWRDAGDPTPSIDELDDRYSNEDVVRDLRETNEYGLAPFTARPGSPTRRALVKRYENQTGRSFENERFYRAHAAFMLATVWEDLHRYQIEAGLDSNRGPYVEYMALFARSIIEGELRL